MKYPSFIILAAVVVLGITPANAGPLGKPSADISGERVVILKAGKLPSLFPPSLPDMGQSPLTQENVQQAVNDQVAAHFKAAAGPQNSLLTAKQAKAAGWGIIADHFSEIDQNSDGFVRLEDVASFLKARSPIQKPEGEKAAKVPVLPKEPIQIIE